ALKYRTEVWASGLFTLTVVLLLTVTVGTTIGRAAALRGFVVFAWGYLVMAFATTPIPRPITTYFLEEARISVQGFTEVPGGNPFRAGAGRYVHSYARGKDYWVFSTDDALYQVSHLLICPAFGLVGAVLGRVMEARGRRSND